MSKLIAWHFFRREITFLVIGQIFPTHKGFARQKVIFWQRQTLFLTSLFADLEKMRHLSMTNLDWTFSLYPVSFEILILEYQYFHRNQAKAMNSI